MSWNKSGALLSVLLTYATRFVTDNPKVSIPRSDPAKSKSSTLYTEPTNGLSTSKTFHAGLSPAPDASLLSSDGVFFCVHLKTIRRHSPEAFQAFLNASSHQTGPVALDCSSEKLNIILHTLYDMPLGAYQPGLDIVAAAIDHMPKLGITVNQVIYPECAMYQHIASYTPLRPLDVYAMAAHHDVHALAVHASSDLVNLDMRAISEDVSVRMGSLYLLKLIRLHAKRSEALKAQLFVALPAHPLARIDTCSFRQHQLAIQIWAQFCADPMWHTRPSTLINLRFHAFRRGTRH